MNFLHATKLKAISASVMIALADRPMSSYMWIRFKKIQFQAETYAGNAHMVGDACHLSFPSLGVRR